MDGFYPSSERVADSAHVAVTPLLVSILPPSYLPPPNAVGPGQVHPKRPRGETSGWGQIQANSREGVNNSPSVFCIKKGGHNKSNTNGDHQVNTKEATSKGGQVHANTQGPTAGGRANTMGGRG